VLARGVEILDELLPLKSWLYFPLLYSACVWAVRRVFDYRERILAWQVWLDPEFVRTKPDGFVLDFFRGSAPCGANTPPRSTAAISAPSGRPSPRSMP